MIGIKNIAGSGREIDCGKVVIKLGSNVVIDSSGVVDVQAIEQLAEDIADLRERGVDVIIVTSGAVGLGRELMKRERPKTIPEKQAMAAVGQISLMHIYQGVLARRGLVAAQLLLTRADMENRQRYLNARHALDRLLEFGAVPIINENDTIAVEELSFGDNDMLSASVAIKMKADLLVLLSTVPGVLREAPAMGADPADIDPGMIVRVIEHDSDELDGMIDETQSGHGTGGMRSKLAAAQEAAKAGVHVVIAGGKTPKIMRNIVSGKFDGTYVPSAREDALSSLERWIGYGRVSKGHALHLDAGAVEALLHKKRSLLPVGVTRVDGGFERGAIIDLIDPEGRTFARGLVNYASGEIDAIKGRRTGEIESVLGSRPYDAIVNRDYLVILQAT